MAASCQVSGTCVCPGCLNVPSPGPPSSRVSLPRSALPFGSQGPGIPYVKSYHKDQGEEGIEHLDIFHVSCWQVPCSISAEAPCYLVFWCSNIWRHPFCCSSYPLPNPAFGGVAFPNPISAHLDSVSIFIPGHLPLLPCLVHFSCLSLVRSSWFTHPGLLPILQAWRGPKSQCA